MTDKAQATSSNQLIERLNKEDEFVIGSLIHVYHHQTTDEMQAKTTAYQNERGFNSADANILSSFSQQYLKKGFLSPKQIKLARQKMKKYTRQIHNDIECLPNGKQEQKSDKPNRFIELSDSGSFLIYFHFDRELIAKIKTLPNRRFHADKKIWSCPSTIEACRSLKEWGFKFSEESEKKRKEIVGEIEIDKIETIPNMKIQPYEYQKEGIAFVHSRNGRAIIGDEMGLGKTIQAIGYLALNPDVRPALIVCPASLKMNWKREIKKFCDLDEQITILDGKTPNPALLNEGVHIINYDIVSHKREVPKDEDGNKIGNRKVITDDTVGWETCLKEHGFQIVIFDEIQKLKDRNSNRTQAFQNIVGIGKKNKNINKVIELSGTPVENCPAEFYTPLKLVRPEMFSWKQFSQRYCNPQWNGFGWDFRGASNTAELHKILTDTLMIRRKKKDVLTELPDKIISTIPFEINNRSEYDRAESDLISWIEDNYGEERALSAMKSEALIRYNYLKQLCVEGKLKSVKNWIDEFLENDQKLVVFCHHKKTIDYLMKQYKKRSVKIVGDMTSQQKQNSVDEFQNNPKINLCFGSESMREGLTLTAASALAFVEFPWTPGSFDQISDRIHRIGQEADSVNIYCLIAEQTIEEDIVEILDEKRKTLTQVLDGQEADTSTLLAELMSRMKRG